MEQFNRVRLLPATGSGDEEIAGSVGWLRSLLTPADLEGKTLADPGILARIFILDGQFLLHYRTTADNLPPNPNTFQSSNTNEALGVEHYKFLSPEAVRVAFSTLDVDTGWLMPGVVRTGWHTSGQPWSVLYVPPGKHTLNLKLPADLLNIRLMPPNMPQENSSGRSDRSTQTIPKAELVRNDFAQFGRPQQTVRLENVPLPGLIFVGIGQEYRVWATAASGEQTPNANEADFDPQAAIYAAPLPNVHEDGRICWGEAQAQVPVALPTAGGIGAAWRLFLASEFTDHLVSSKSQSYSADVRHGLLAALLNRQTVYPSAELVPYRLSMGGIGNISVATALEKLLAARSAA
jgi:hypothetical protein